MNLSFATTVISKSQPERSLSCEILELQTMTTTLSVLISSSANPDTSHCNSRFVGTLQKAALTPNEYRPSNTSISLVLAVPTKAQHWIQPCNPGQPQTNVHLSSPNFYHQLWFRLGLDEADCWLGLLVDGNQLEHFLTL